jgi:DNA-binding NarL/FixJ family response regulator
MRQVLCDTLARDIPAARVVAAKDGLEAVTKAKQLRPAAVVMDFHLPHLNGVEATRQIKKLHPATWIVFFSMFDSAQDRLAARQAGADHYLRKDEGTDDLVRTLKTWLYGA